MLKEKMKKIFYIILTIILSLIFVSCDIHSDVGLILNQVNTTWVSENHDIFFTIPEEGGFNVRQGILKTSEKSYNIMMSFDYGSDDLNILDYDIAKKNNFIYGMEEIILRADCDFDEKNFTAKVTESFIDSIKAGDKITFNRVEELPEWANDITQE